MTTEPSSLTLRESVEELSLATDTHRRGGIDAAQLGAADQARDPADAIVTLHAARLPIASAR